MLLIGIILVFSLFIIFDFSHRPQYELRIEVRDQGSNPGVLIATSTLTVEVMDINDNNPVMQQTTYTASISECEPPYSTIVTIAADDKDFGENILKIRNVENPKWGLFFCSRANN